VADQILGGDAGHDAVSMVSAALALIYQRRGEGVDDLGQVSGTDSVPVVRYPNWRQANSGADPITTVEFLPFGLDWTRVAETRFSGNKDLPDDNAAPRRQKVRNSTVVCVRK